MKRKPSRTPRQTFQLRCSPQVRARKKAITTSGCGVCKSQRMPAIIASMTAEIASKSGERLSFIQSKMVFATLPTGIL